MIFLSLSLSLSTLGRFDRQRHMMMSKSTLLSYAIALRTHAGAYPCLVVDTDDIGAVREGGRKRHQGSERERSIK
jgi:hypothetical protein